MGSGRLVILLVILAGLAIAGSAQGAAGPVEREIQALFWAITWFALLVAAIVYGALFWFLIRYRRSANPIPAHIEGNRKLEMVWSIFPTVILIIITGISVPVLVYTDTLPPHDLTVVVEAQQFSWKFSYIENGATAPTLNTTGELWIQEDIVVLLKVTSRDVIHSFAAPQLGVKIDAIPGRYNVWWLQADEPGDYLNQCAEFCGVGHYGMRATIHVFRAGSQPRIFGPPPTSLRVTEVELRDFGGTATAPWSIAPANLTAKIGDTLILRIWNNDSVNPHDFRVDEPVNASVGAIQPFGIAWLNVTIDAPASAPVLYGPSDNASRDQGMVGYLAIQSGRVVVVILEEWTVRTKPSETPLRIAKGETVVFEVRNEGQFDHNFRLDPPYEDVYWPEFIPPGGKVFLDPYTFDIEARGDYYCAVPGHRTQGMQAPYVVGNPLEPVGGTVPIFDMMLITFAVGIPTTFVYLVHHARRRDEG